MYSLRNSTYCSLQDLGLSVFVVVAEKLPRQIMTTIHCMHCIHWLLHTVNPQEM